MERAANDEKSNTSGQVNHEAGHDCGELIMRQTDEIGRHGQQKAHRPPTTNQSIAGSSHARGRGII